MMAGAGGVEPPNDDTKNRCLTTWLRPKKKRILFKNSYFSKLASSFVRIDEETEAYSKLIYHKSIPLRVISINFKLVNYYNYLKMALLTKNRQTAFSKFFKINFL